MRDEVTRRLSPMCMEDALPAIKDMVAIVMDVFNGIETAKKEAAVLKKTLPLLELAPRTLGTRTLTVQDAEGVVYRTKTVSCPWSSHNTLTQCAHIMRSRNVLT
jgi:hypothetical protein